MSFYVPNGINNPVVKVIAQRDGLSYADALVKVREATEAMNEAVVAHDDDPSVILEQELGLEPDYLLDLL